MFTQSAKGCPRFYPQEVDLESLGYIAQCCCIPTEFLSRRMSTAVLVGNFPDAGRHLPFCTSALMLEQVHSEERAGKRAV